MLDSLKELSEKHLHKLCQKFHIVVSKLELNTEKEGCMRVRELYMT